MTAEAGHELDRTLHQPARIRIMSRLMVLRQVRFARLRKITGLSPGNLASHLAALERAGYVTSRHAIFEAQLGKYAAITQDGETAFRAYVLRLEALLRELRSDLPP